MSFILKSGAMWHQALLSICFNDRPSSYGNRAMIRARLFGYSGYYVLSKFGISERVTNTINKMSYTFRTRNNF